MCAENTRLSRGRMIHEMLHKRELYMTYNTRVQIYIFILQKKEQLSI